MPTTDSNHKFHKILIADDSSTERLNLTRVLETAGYQVIQVHSGNEAKQSVEQYNPDLIMLDIMLPELDGWQVCREIRKKSQCPIIMLTAKGEVFDY